jgi:tetratricopeptide (TPR) repeat protein
MQALDELVARWRKNPDPESTLALCAHLGTSAEAELMHEVATAAEAWHRDNHTVQLSVGRMYLDGGLLAEAQAALTRAGKLEPNDAEAYRYLGEVLLRRGDATRSEKALARAIALGDDDAETRLWHERSVVYVALQKRQGMTAVADEVARTAPHQPSIPAPTLSPFDRLEQGSSAGGTRTKRRSRPPHGSSRSAGRRRSSVAPPGRRRGSTPPPGGPAALGPKSPPQDTLLMGRSPLPTPPLGARVQPPAPFFPKESHAPKPAHSSRARAGGLAPASAEARRAAVGKPRSSLAELMRESTEASRVDRESATRTHPDAEPAPDPFQGTFSDAPAADHDLLSPEAAPAAVSLAPPPLSSRAPLTSSRRARAVSEAPIPPELPGRGGPPPPDELEATPEMILSMLARVGLYERESAVVPAWEAAPRPAPRRLWIIGGALLLAMGMGVGGYRYALGVQGDRLARAQELGMHLSSALDSGSRAQLLGSEADFLVLFELDSRGKEPALLWLTNRALHTLLENEPVSGIESALQRARAVGVDERRVIFGRLASSLAAGDLPGAGTTIAEWDQRAKDDPLYQLFAGAVFERAGNPEALDRYVAATRLQPDLKVAHALAARLALLQLGPGAAKSIVEVARARLGPGLASDVLGGLEWATSSFTGASGPALPPALALQDLSPPMQDAASAVIAVKALREGRPEESMTAFDRALGAGASPAMAAWIGYQALDAGNVEVARRAAVKAVQLSALHRSSQALAARIALAEGRLDAAREAVRGLDPRSRDAVLLEAVSAYENLQGPVAMKLLASLPPDPAAAPTLEALQASDRVISGAVRPKDDRLTQLASERKLWGAVVAVDLALDAGRLETAEAIVKGRAWDGQVPAYAARMMRLMRYQGQGSAALELAPALSDPKRTTPRAVAELVLSLVGEDRAAAASNALRDMSDAAGSLAPWLEAIVEASGGRQPSAAKIVAELQPPDKTRPLLEQVVALRALGAAKDRRAKAYYSQLERRFKGQPDVALAGKRLGMLN